MATCETSGEARSSSRMFSAKTFIVFKSVSPKRTIDRALDLNFCWYTTGFSALTGKEPIRSTAFLTSVRTLSISAPRMASMLTTPTFSEEVEVTRSIPSRPSRFSSILRMTPSSTSSGEAPGYRTWIMMRFGAISGKVE